MKPQQFNRATKECEKKNGCRQKRSRKRSRLRRTEVARRRRRGRRSGWEHSRATAHHHGERRRASSQGVHRHGARHRTFRWRGCRHRSRHSRQRRATKGGSENPAGKPGGGGWGITTPLGKLSETDGRISSLSRIDHSCMVAGTEGAVNLGPDRAPRDACITWWSARATCAISRTFPALFQAGCPARGRTRPSRGPSRPCSRPVALQEAVLGAWSRLVISTGVSDLWFKTLGET